MELPYRTWIDHAPLPTGVLHRGRFVYGNAALLELLGATLEVLTSMRLEDPIAPEDRERVRKRYERRLAGQRVPGTYGLTVLRPDGGRRATEIAVSRAGEYVVFQLLDQTDEVARRERVRAVAKLGAAVQAQHSQEAIFAATEAGLIAIGLGAVRLVPIAPDRLRVASVALPDASVLTRFREIENLLSSGLEGPRMRAFDQAWADGSVYLDDTASDAEIFMSGGAAGEMVRNLAHSSALERTILLRIDVRNEPQQILAIMGGWLRPEDMPTFALFATQISAALDAALVIGDLSARNAELSALNHVAAAAGMLADLSELFERSTDEICNVFGSVAAAIFLVDEPRNELVLTHQRGWLESVFAPYRRVPLEGSNLGAVARAGVSRVLRRRDYTPEQQQLMTRLEQHVVVSVPLRVRAKTMGVLNVVFGEEAEVTPRQVEMLEAMAAHLAAAVEANRLVTDLRASYADLTRTQEQLVQRERLAALGELAAAVAHEVRNPLGVIFNSLSSLQKLPPNDHRGRMLLGILGEEAHRLNQIVGDLIDFARPSNPSLRPGALHSVLDDAIDAALARVSEPVSVSRHYDADITAVPMDARLMRQALLNVLQNAVQAMPGGGTVTVRTRREVRNGRDGARIEVADSGAGIAPEVMPRIFEPFFTTRATGTGLGLAVVKRIVENHRGEIDVHSEPGRGATFAIWLPE